MNDVAAEKARRGLVRDAVADVLLDRAAWVHARLDSAKRCGVDLYEETLTQDLLLDISQVLPGLLVQTFSRHQEARNGADWQWEWWFHGYRWFGIRTQAKRLKVLKNGVLGYDLGYRTGRRRLRQVDLLIDSASIDGVQAAYALYNGPDLDTDSFRWICHRLPPSSSFFGVSFLPGVLAQRLATAKRVGLADVAALSRPWSCLVACPPFGGCGQHGRPWGPWYPGHAVGEEDAELDGWVARAFFRFALHDQYRGRDRSSEYEQAINQRSQRYTNSVPPSYIDQLLNGRGVGTVNWPDRVRAVTIFNVGALQ